MIETRKYLKSDVPPGKRHWKTGVSSMQRELHA